MRARDALEIVENEYIGPLRQEIGQAQADRVPVSASRRDMGRRRSRYLPQIPLRRQGSPDEIAQAIAWVASDAPGFMTGQVITIDGGRSLS